MKRSVVFSQGGLSGEVGGGGGRGRDSKTRSFGITKGQVMVKELCFCEKRGKKKKEENGPAEFLPGGVTTLLGGAPVARKFFLVNLH